MDFTIEDDNIIERIRKSYSIKDVLYNLRDNCDINTGR